MAYKPNQLLMKKITVFILLLSSINISIAQISISGTVSNDSIPLESASVIIKNSKTGIATNSKGQFKIKAEKGDTLSISYLGYETKEFIVDESYYLKVKLEEEWSLDEVVVIAYATVTKCIWLNCGRDGRWCGGFSCDAGRVDEISEFTSNGQKLYPNPSSNGIFELNLAEDYSEVKILVANLSGQYIKNSTYQKFGKKLTIDLSQCVTGIYFINIIADGQRLEALKAIRD